ncbi:2-dehydropantoate 2-reductase [Janibacter anophelis]|uniref:2-dehydropantoate 2-reductase n=1 Tax=Janibacter anophelis TaxID=319054 RepID=UPI00082AABAF|nr:2-dehydropantoate 2-reductase [Janibacter anophelis]
MERTRVAVMGAGSVGCYLGGWLAAAADVTLIGRAPLIDAIERDGLTVTDLRGRSRTARPDGLTLATDASAVVGADYVLLTTKTLGTAMAVRQVAPYLQHDSIVISFQNGLRNATQIDEALAAAFPSRASRPLVLSGMVPFNVVRTGETRWEQATSGHLAVKDHPRVDPFTRVAQGGGLRVEVEPDMKAVLFGKLLLNLNNAVNALTGQPLAVQLRDRDCRVVLAACQDESLALARRLGVSPARLTPLPAAAMPALLRSPTPVFANLARASLKVSPTARSSMADDLDAGRSTEIDELQGAIVHLARDHGVQTPVCARIVELVREAERSGPDRHRWTGVQLRRAVGL